MPDFNCYIDEAGDDGFSFARGSSRWFVVAAVMVDVTDDHSASQCVDRIKKRLSIPPLSPLHWRKLKHPKRLVVLSEVTGEPVVASIIAIDKTSLGPATALAKQGALYFYALRFLLERVTWFVDDSGGKVTVSLSHRTRVSYADLAAYLALLQQMPRCQIRPVIAGPLRPIAMVQHKMLQVADVFASAAFNALEINTYGMADESYFLRLEPQLYRRKGRCRSYGWKLFPDTPTHVPMLLAQYPWLSRLGY